MQFETLVGELEPVSFNVGIFSDARFNALVDITTSVSPESFGRLDPLAPISGGVTYNMNILGLLVDKGLLSKSDRALVETELTKKGRSLADVLAGRGISLTQALTIAGRRTDYRLDSRRSSCQ